MLLIYLPVVLTVLCYSLYYYFTRTFNYWKKRNVKGPEPIAFFGNLKNVTLRYQNVSHTYKELYNMFPKEKAIGIYRMTTPCLLIRDLDIIKHIMIKDHDLFQERGIDFSQKGLGANLFHADGEIWSILRSRLNPIFTPGKLKGMFHLLHERANIFMNHLEAECRRNHEYEVHELTQKYTISTIFACAFGVDFDGFHSKVDNTLRTVDEMILTPNYGFELDMMYPGLLKKLNLSLFPAKVTNFFQKLVTDIISQRNGTPTTRGDFMDLILSMRQMGEVGNLKNKQGIEKKAITLTDDLIAAQAFVFYVGGYETSATTMTYLLYHLALQPEIQDRLRQEIDDVMKDHNDEITYEALNEMKYLDKALSEALRMYPILDPLQRRAKVDYKLPGTDVTVKKNQMVLIPVSGIHYDENYYSNPEVFDPDRFDSELVRARHVCAYLPFGVGPRNCIGMRFGSLQSRLCIAKIISKFRVEISENTKIPIEANPNRLIMGPKGGVLLNIIPKEYL